MMPASPKPAFALGWMETATRWLLSAGSLHLQQAQLIAGKGHRDLHHAVTGGWGDWRTPRASFIPAQDNVLGLEFGHSGRAHLSEKTLVWSGGGPDHGLVGGWCLCGGKGHRVVGQLLAEERDQVQTGGPFGSATPL